MFARFKLFCLSSVAAVLILSGCGGGSRTTTATHASDNTQTPVSTDANNTNIPVSTETTHASDNTQTPVSTDVNNTNIPVSTDSQTLRIYVAGESIEEYNHMNTLPFNADGTLSSTLNTTEEFGWMVPFAQRLQIRNPALSIEWVGSGCWTNADTYSCSTGTYTHQTIGHTSAVAGSSVEDWFNLHGSELTNKSYCYDIAFASRGGNDLNGDIDKNAYEAKLKELVIALDQGSNCRNHPIVYVTAHMLDAVGMVSIPSTQNDVDNWLERQKAYYVDIAQKVVNDLNTNGRKVRFIDMWTPIYDNRATDAFPSEDWWTTANGVHRPNIAKIHREDDELYGYHPRRLASIFVGECAANQVDLTQLQGIE
ncbi:MAG: hypothetical protein KU38_08710 [Sulfurovum sp. FS08-3]|nr:MAG: hypothetical protein KU38_08710 [Sulfurovum sp. FS08-3]